MTFATREFLSKSEKDKKSLLRALVATSNISQWAVQMCWGAGRLCARVCSWCSGARVLGCPSISGGGAFCLARRMRDFGVGGWPGIKKVVPFQALSRYYSGESNPGLPHGKRKFYH